MGRQVPWTTPLGAIAPGFHIDCWSSRGESEAKYARLPVSPSSEHQSGPSKTNPSPYHEGMVLGAIGRMMRGVSTHW